MFDIFERIDAAKEHHEQLLTEAEERRRFPDRKFNAVQFMANFQPIRVGKFLIVLGTRLKNLYLRGVMKLAISSWLSRRP
jgi:hypothetical protein